MKFCYSAPYVNVLHFVEAGIILNFRLSHGDDTTVFKNMLEEFLSHVVSRKRKKSEDSSFSVQVYAQRKKMIAALGKGEKVCDVDDIKKYFTVNFIINAFEEHQDKIIWDEKTKTTVPGNEESDQPLTPTGGSKAPKPSHSRAPETSPQQSAAAKAELMQRATDDQGTVR